MVEFAVVTPIILLTLLGAFDAARYMLLNQKLDRAAATMSDLVSRPSNISAAEINQLMDAAVEVVLPFDLATSGGVIVSSVYKNPGDSAEVTWQITGGGPLTPASAVGGVGDTASMPSGFLVRDNENIITAEVYFDYEPIFLDVLKNLVGAGQLLPEGVIVQTAYRQPRLGDLSSLATP
ncbi:TadE/TadG family type IV pilus assembly protein [Pelagibius sp. Alg239-R121]|uniref:TadE/TadG family type IV pilus assembly protein n=1 Tax=Pelagibius sp. Alg239-R121 TaxID=2993448 RepID=UPI0024A62063|nr:pilus assembly protein [Pelagibius sp. Alg239-R121]